LSHSTGDFAVEIAAAPREGEVMIGVPRKPSSAKGLIVGLTSASLAMVCVFQGILQVLIPDQVQHINPLHKVGDLALMTTLAAALAVVGSVAGGALSDRTHSRFGRRSPWLIAMAVIATALMVTAGAVHNLLVIAAIFAVLWFCMNFYAAALNAIIPDRVPESSRGIASSAVGFGGALGLGLGVNAVAHLSIEWGYAVLAALLLAATALCVGFTREWKTPELPTSQASEDPKVNPAGAPKYHWLGLFQGFLSRDFTLAFVTRALSFTALATVGGYTYYLLQDHIGAAHLPGHNVKGAIGILTAVQMTSWIVGVIGAGWLADRLDRRKMFVGICSIGVAVSMLVPLLSPTWIGMLIFYILLGFFFGIYLSVDLALMTLVLPSRENEGRDLAVLSIANAGPQLLSPAIAAAIISTAGYDALFWFGFAASLLAGVAVFFIRSVR
jgi:MFS family permease